MELRSDPNALAPERLLVFEVRGPIAAFIEAIRRVPGSLELVDEEELEADSLDADPALYLLVPDVRALREILSLWQRWVLGQNLGRGFTPWRDVFATLRDIRPWGPRDRLREEERTLIASDLESKNDDERTHLEIELVYRSDETKAAAAHATLVTALASVGGRALTQCRIREIGYHAILAELPVRAVKDIVALTPGSIAALDPVMHIRPQSVASAIDLADGLPTGGEATELPVSPRPAIVALLDGVPVSQHPVLAGTLIVDDQFELEPLALVAQRDHGTAMASLIANGDRNSSSRRLGRYVHVVPVLGAEDKFPQDRLIVDLIYQAVLRMRGGEDPTAPDVLVVNLSLGNTNRLFRGQMSAWARLLDRFSYQFGILFIVSAGNHATAVEIPTLSNFGAYQSATPLDRAAATLSGLAQSLQNRRLISPAETVNGLTIGAANSDSVASSTRRVAAMAADPFPSIRTSNPSSALGPGFANCVKPDVLMPGGREHLKMVASGSCLLLKPAGPSPSYGLKVAVPPRAGNENAEHFTSGTSAAAALATRACHQIHDALESAYGVSFSSLSHAMRASLLKALMVHSADTWPTETVELIKSVLGPADNRLHVRQKENVRRFIGFGIANPDFAIQCTDDRATFWAVSVVPRDQTVTIRVPIPACASGQSKPHALHGTLAWLSPVAFGRQSYRAVRLKLLEPEYLATLQVNAQPGQPDTNSGRRGTVFSRRWAGTRAPAISTNHVLEFAVQREPDQGGIIDEPIPFAVAFTFTMPGVVGIYEEVRARLAVETSVRIQ